MMLACGTLGTPDSWHVHGTSSSGGRFILAFVHQLPATSWKWRHERRNPFRSPHGRAGAVGLAGHASTGRTESTAHGWRWHGDGAGGSGESGRGGAAGAATPLWEGGGGGRVKGVERSGGGDARANILRMVANGSYRGSAEAEAATGVAIKIQK